MPSYALNIDGDLTEMQPGWSLHETANGGDTLMVSVLSLDGSNRPALDAPVLLAERVGLVSSSVANPTHLVTDEPHGVVTGQTIEIYNHVGSTPAISGAYVATVITPTELTIPVDVTVAGAGGTLERRIYGGTIATPEEVGLGGPDWARIRTDATCADFNAVAERRHFNGTLLAGDLIDQLTALATALGLTLHPAQVTGPAMPEQPFEWAKLQDVLNQTTVLSGGYVWEFDTYDRLRMFLPNTEAAPVNVVDGNGVAIGDITVSPTRSEYANYIILRFSAAAVAAYGFLGVTGNFSDTETVTLGGTTYTFQTVLTDVAGHVLIGADINESLDNLVAAITLGGGSGSVYAASTLLNGSATAYRFADGGMKAIALTTGAAGNSIPATTTAVDAEWHGEGGVGIVTLARGADQSLSNISIAKDDTEIAAHGQWETLIEAAATTDQAEADTLSAAYLAVHLPVPKTVKYDTYAIGLRPGQTQTIQVANRNVNNQFLITDVDTRNTAGNLVMRSVTAIESLLLPAQSRWRDTWKQMLQGGPSSGAAGSVSGGGSVINVTGAIYGFGGSQTEWVQTTAGGWVNANSIEIAIDTATRGSLLGTVYVRIRATAGSVTARLRNRSDSTTAGTSEAITNTSFVTVAFPVVLTPGKKIYGIDLSCSLADTDVSLGSAYLE